MFNVYNIFFWEEGGDADRTGAAERLVKRKALENWVHQRGTPDPGFQSLAFV